MKRWICLFLSLAVCVSVLSLGVHAEEEIDNSILELYVYSSIVSSTTSDFATEIPQQGAITERSISNNTNQAYTKIKNFSFSCPANSYFLIDFDIVAYDPNNFASNQRPYCFASRNISQYVATDFSVSGSNGSPTILRAEVRNYFWENGTYGFVHYSIFGLNDINDYNNIVISYTNPITVTSSLVTGSNIYFNQRIQNVNCKTSVSLDTITAFIEEISQTLSLTYSEIISIGDTLDTFHSDFLTFWNSFSFSFPRIGYGFIELRYDSNGIGTSYWRSNYSFGSSLITSLNSINQYLSHHMKLENKSIENGSQDTYDSLSDSADFGSLSDFAGVGSAASWSSGSFVDGLDSGFIWFSNDTKNSLDTVPVTRRNEQEYISVYDDVLSEYQSILDGD